jgi:hypothetical protein
MLVPLALSAQDYVDLHPKNPHYFVYKGKPLILITSAEHYGALINLDFDYRVYLQTLKADGLNLTRTFSGAYVEPPGAFKIAENTLAPAPDRFIAPWQRVQGENKFDLSRWNERYFSRLRDFVSVARDNAVIVEFTFFCPFYEDVQWQLSPMNAANNVNNVGTVSRTDVYTLDRNGGLLAIQEALVKKIVTELRAFGNVIYEICNEPYFGGVTMEWQHHIADVIMETEKGLGVRHLISQNIANETARIDDPHPGVSVFNFHYAWPPVAVAQNYRLNKVIGDNETGFDGTADSTYRREGWAFILAGGALYNNLDYSFTAGHETGTFAYPSTQPGGGSKDLRRQLGYLKAFMERFDFVSMLPDSTVASGLNPGVNAQVLVEEGRQYAMYLSGEGQQVITLRLPTGSYSAEWLNPETGAWQPPVTVAAREGSARLRLPDYRFDVALRLVRSK